MDLLQFFASLAASLVWPVLVGITVVVYRRPLRTLLDRLGTVKEVRWGDAAFAFEKTESAKEQLDRWAATPQRSVFHHQSDPVVESTANSVKPPAAGPSDQPPTRRRRSSSGWTIAGTPAEWVMQEWDALEREVLHRSGLLGFTFESIDDAMAALAQPIAEALNDLKDLRDAVADDRIAIDPESALKFALTCADVLDMIQVPPGGPGSEVDP